MHLQSKNFQLSFEGGNSYHNRRSLEDGELLFLSNASMEIETKGTMQIKGADALLMDLFTGEILDYPEQERPDGQITLDVSIPPAGSVLLFISNKKQKNLAQYRLSPNKSIVKSSKTQIFET